MKKELECPICASSFVNLQPFPEYRNKDGAGYACAACGTFYITHVAEVNSRSQRPDARFPAWIRQHEENQLAPPFITSTLLEEEAKKLPNYTPSEKQLILLKAIERRTKYPGCGVLINDWIDYPLAWATNAEELNYLLKALEQRNFIQHTRVNNEEGFSIRPEGWEYLEQQKRNSSVGTDAVKNSTEQMHERGNMVILKPLSEDIWKEIEKDYDITKKIFGKKINFVKDKYKRSVIFRDVEHACFLAGLGLSKPAVILAGSVIEELLRLYLASKSVKIKNDNFSDYIKTCETNGLLKSAIHKLSDSVRHFRNIVHLSKETSSKITISKATAKGAVSSIFTIANDF